MMRTHQRTRASLVVVPMLVGLLSASAHAQDLLPELRELARGAAGEKNYCHASFYFEWIYDEAGEPKELYNAAEVAYAADDRSRALRLYQKLRDNHPGFHKLDTVRQRLRSLATLMADTGFGKICKAPKKPSAAPPPDDPKDPPPKDPPPPDRPANCGDGKLQNDEICDDGNLDDGDGCDSNCKPSGCLNGVVAGEEACDDGNVEDGDGCDTNCTVTGCGNGIRTAGESCDDGNTDEYDGCDAMCRVEEPGKVRPKDEGDPNKPPPDKGGGGGGGGALAWTTSGVGVLLTVGGAVGAFIGALPAVNHGRIKGQLEGLEAELDGASREERDAILDEAATLNDRQAAAERQWNSALGMPLAIGGGIAAVVGLGMTIGGLTWALSE